MQGDVLGEALQKQCAIIGVDWKSRNIVFHSWRHFYAARMSDIKTAEEVARITGHKSRAVFDEYAAHVEKQNLEDMGRAAQQVFGGVLEALPAGVDNNRHICYNTV
jgi:integrase